jgi:putative membrane protein
MAGRTIAAVAARIAARRLDRVVHGLEHVPASGPVLIVARHFHHLYDGVVLLSAVPRRLHVVVALDWTRTRRERAVMEWAVRAARWPALLRDDALAPGRPPSAFRPDEAARYRLAALRLAVDLLAGGAAVLIFPEAYPNIDPRFTPKTRPGEMLPFRPGFAVIRDLARRRTGTDVPVVPAGLAYEPGPRWRATLRFGPALPADAPALVRLAEREVAALSAAAGRSPGAPATAVPGGVGALRVATVAVPDECGRIPPEEGWTEERARVRRRARVVDRRDGGAGERSTEEPRRAEGGGLPCATSRKRA